jgi:hypothetical protein
MAARTGTIALLITATLVAVPPRPASANPPAAAASPGSVSPHISPRVPAAVGGKVAAAWELAAERATRVPECRRLFTELGRDPMDVLSMTIYYPAELKLERRLCPRAYAYTVVGGAPTWLCRRFSRLSEERAAAVLLHEALHHAGLTEQPRDPDGLRPGEIQDMVEEACGL